MVNKAGVLEAEKDSTKKNKTGSWRSVRPVFTEKCIGCAMCVKYCPENAIKVDEKTKKAKVNYDYCKGCLVCMSVCPVHAIEQKDEE